MVRAAKSEKSQILVVETTSDITRRLKKLLDEGNVKVSREPNPDRLVKKFRSQPYDVLVITGSALKAGRVDGQKLLEEIADNSPITQVLFLAEQGDIADAISALKAGIYHYARLPVTDEELGLLVSTALEKKPLYGINLFLESRKHEVRFEKLIGRSGPMKQVYRQIRQAAATKLPVLLLGETGTGKDLAAQAIHKQSDRSRGAYVAVNLGALPAELVASELFGYEKGAFTGAAQQREGKFEQARDGTVFLDEIATIDEKVQVSLLRLIEHKKFHRLGGKRAVSTNARLIAASNQDLFDAVKQGFFREDLYYRLDVFRIVMPPLRERLGDIPLLVDEFLKRYNRSLQKDISGITPECVSLLEGYSWPGNVRELKNVIQRAVLVCEGDILLPEHLPPRFRPDRPARPIVSFRIGTPLKEVEHQMVTRALAAADNNRKRAAELLGISRRALYNKLRKFNIE